MGEETIFDKVRATIGSIAFGIFLWSLRMTQEQYCNEIYEQEKRERLE